MKSGEKGYSLVELIIGVSIMVFVSGAAGAGIYQILKNTERNSDYITNVNQIENAGFLIGRDAQMALSVTASENLTEPEFLSLSWTEWDEDGNPTYYTANYTVENRVNGIGQLHRYFSVSNGTTSDTLVAQYIYYDLNGAQVSSNTSFENSVLTVTITAIVDEITKTREFIITHRPGL